MAIDQKKKKQFIAAENPIEQLKDIGMGVVQEAKSLPSGILDTALEQIGLKPQRQPLSGEINLASGVHKTTEKIDQKGASLDAKLSQLKSVQSQEKEVYSAKQKALEQQIGKIMHELQLEVKKLEEQTSELTGEVRAVTVATIPTKPGAYHLNYFEFVISMLRDLRKRVNESRMWLKVWANKKQQKGYWAMFKKHGTGFAMSDERSAATSIG